MISKIELEIEKDNVVIIVDNITKKKINVKNKTINTKEIYKILDYNESKTYKIVSDKIKESELKGAQNEIKRLYNYVYELFDGIVIAVNKVTVELKQKKQ
ncbi:MAG: hypothetical protein PHG18_00795 [Bacilli bacterium]|nr:hypothetical protein [Bacilli bacterium]